MFYVLRNSASITHKPRQREREREIQKGLLHNSCLSIWPLVILIWCRHELWICWTCASLCGTNFPKCISGIAEKGSEVVSFASHTVCVFNCIWRRVTLGCELGQKKKTQKKRASTPIWLNHYKLITGWISGMHTERLTRWWEMESIGESESEAEKGCECVLWLFLGLNVFTIRWKPRLFAAMLFCRVSMRDRSDGILNYK